MVTTQSEKGNIFLNEVCLNFRFSLKYKLLKIFCKMLSFWPISVSVIIFLSSANALNCWVCNNAPSNQACLAKGKLLKCQDNEKACQSEIRKGSYGQLITKQCKQVLACDNNFDQNRKAAWYPTQCNNRFSRPSVCRCCCSTDGCNTPSFGCISSPRINLRLSTCFPPHPPRNGLVQCSAARLTNSAVKGRMSLGTACKFTCQQGFNQRGAAKVMCNRRSTTGRARFSRASPLCTPNTCLVQQAPPENGDVTCTNKNQIASICHFHCRNGYVINGYSSTKCLSTRSWSNQRPSCVRMRCAVPHIDPSNGLVTCDSESYVGSKCRFQCLSGYALQGAPLSECEFDSSSSKHGKWSTRAPICLRIKCEPQTVPFNGEVTCSDGREEGSVCEFACSTGYYISGSSAVTCLDDEDDDEFGRWSGLPPRCIPLLCRFLRAPSNGRMRCTRFNLIGSRCQLTCNSGYDLVGSANSVCEQTSGRNAEWSSLFAQCVAIRCSPYSNSIEHGEMMCTNGNSASSSCHYRCDRGYALHGSQTITCGMDGLWSSDPPTCIRRICSPPPEALANSARVCSEGPGFHSQCSYICHEGYTRNGASLLSCVEDENGEYNWDNHPPTCEGVECPNLPPIHHGDVKCSEDSRAGSICSFECKEEGFTLYPSNHSTFICQKNRTWSGRLPCCAQPCPPFALMDLVLVLDSSSSIGITKWKIMKSFVRSFLDSFAVSSNASRMSILRYNARIDTESLIRLGDYSDDKSGLLSAFDAIPYNGRGTRTGNAVQYVSDVILKEANGDRPGVKDVVVVITDGRARDGRLLSSASRQLRQRGALVYAIGVAPGREGSLDEQQLHDIAGSSNRVLIAKSGFEELGEILLSQLSGQICDNRCENELSPFE